MPSSYAHYRFGKVLLPGLPGEVRSCIQHFRRMYDVGLQGPDPFFYYNFFWDTPIGSLGNQFHSQSGREFFATAAKAAKTEAAQAYLYGLLGHYCLDSRCHPYIQQIEDIGEAAHVALESEFDRYLLVLDKKQNPASYDISRHLKLTRGECMSVAEFYPGATGGSISRSVKNMAFAKRFLASPKRRQREKLLSAVKPSLCEHFTPETEQMEMVPYIRELKELYDSALERYPILLAQLQACLEQGEPLGDAFEATFG